MLKKEKIESSDSSLKFMSKGEASSIYRMSDGRVAKFLSDYSLFNYDLLGVNFYDKLDYSNVMEGIDGISLPISAICDNLGNCIGFTMEYNNGISLNEFDDNMSLFDRSNLMGYIERSRKINALIKKCNSVDVVFPDLLTCDNIMFSEDGNVSFIDIDGFQIGKYPSLAVSSSLGDPVKLLNLGKYKKSTDSILWSCELDKKSLMYLFFLDCFNCNLDKIGTYNPFEKKNITLNSIVNTIGLDDIKIQRIVKSCIDDYANGQYLDKFYDLLEKRYCDYMVAVSYSSMGYPVSYENRNACFKKLIRK